MRKKPITEDRKVNLGCIIWMLIFIIILMAFSCTKPYIEKQPTCQRIYELSDKYYGDKTYWKTDTLWPWGRYNNVFCNEDTLWAHNYIPVLLGCPEGWFESIRYVIGNKITKPIIYK